MWRASMLLLSNVPSCLQKLTGCTSIASLLLFAAQASSITALYCCSCPPRAYTHKNALPLQRQHILQDNTVVQGSSIAASCHSPQSLSQYDIQQLSLQSLPQYDIQRLSNDRQQSYAEFLLALRLHFACCRQLFLQTPFRHEIHSDVQERIQEAFETGCEFREIAACFTQQGDIVTFQLLFLPVRPYHVFGQELMQRKERTMPFGINSMRGQILYQAAQ